MLRSLFLAAAVSSCMAIGCGEQPTPSTSGAGTDGAQAVGNASGSGTENQVRGTIGFSALTLTNPFFNVIADTMKAEAARHGYEVLVVSGENDVRKQADQVSEFIVRGVSAIVLNPCDSKSIGPAIVRANEAGIPVFTNDIKYDGAEGKVVCHVATDNFQGGRLAGEAMVRLLGESGGKVAILHFPQVESCQLRVKGFQEVVDAHNAQPGAAAIQVVATLDGGGARDAGFRSAKDAVESHPDLAAIFAINDPSALGAYAALEAAGRADQVTIIGFDGQPIGKQAILDGKILCDPIQFPDRIGKATIDAIIRHFDGEAVEPEILIASELYYQADAENDPALRE